MPMFIKKKALDGSKPSVSVIKLAIPTGKALTSEAMQRENSFNQLYENEGTAGAFKPPYDPDQMYELKETNNILSACIDAMETNIDGTGFEILPEDKEGEVDEATQTKLKGFFSQPYPGTSFTTLRKQLRRDLESTGNAYVEVIRNLLGEVALMRRMDPGITRVMRFDDRTFDEQVWSAALGEYITVRMKRRRYVQYWFGKHIYFKEFGASAELDKNKGHWGTNVPSYQDTAPEGGRSTTTGSGEPITVGPQNRATEVLHLMAVPHHILPYGIPRWVAQIPSVVGSRKAEEFNLGFFDAGGVPPMLIVVQGGETSDDVEKALKGLFYSEGTHKNVAAILNVQSSGGSLEKESPVKVTVERFGSERQKDAMFLEYDKSCADHVRRAFRLPPLFTGDTDDYNYATALASYRVAEMQVFRPLRDEFDEKINMILLPVLLGKPGEPNHEHGVMFRSLPLTPRDAADQLKTLELAINNKLIDWKEAVVNLNEVSGLEMEPNAKDPAEAALEQASLAAGRDAEGNPLPLPTPPINPNLPKPGATKMKPGSAPRKPANANKRDINQEDVMVADALFAIRTGKAENAFDSVDFMSRLDPEQKDRFARRIGKALFKCKPEEEDACAHLAVAQLTDLSLPRAAE